MAKQVYSKEKWCFPKDKVLNHYNDEVALPTDELMREIFAPDPITGNPSSDIRLMVHGENQELNEYIRTHLLNSVGQGSLLGLSDADGEAALDALPTLNDSNESYFKRLSELASGSSQKTEVE